MQLSRGYSLIELMITMVIVAILAAVAYPSYAGYQASASRNKAKVVLLQIASKLESFYDRSSSYSHATLSKLGFHQHIVQLPYRFYIAKLSAQHYTIQAVPTKLQRKRDPLYGRLQITDKDTVHESIE